jgi:hypothetical protein
VTKVEREIDIKHQKTDRMQEQNNRATAAYREFPVQAWDLLVMIILASMCGSETWVEIADYCIGKREWLKTLLGYDHETPSDSTLRRICTRLVPGGIKNMYREWGAPYADGCRNKHIGIDGKTIRGVATG